MIRYKNEIFLLLAGLILVAAVYHFLGIFYKIDQLPLWRHAIFLLANIFCVYGLIKRPGYFVVFFIVFTCQQYYSHIQQLWEVWEGKHMIHWNSALVLAILPPALAFLIADYFSQFDNLIAFNEMEEE